MHETAIAVIVEHFEENLFAPAKNWPDKWFTQRSYERWAAGEILTLVMNNPKTPAITIIESFMIQMLIFSSKAKDTKGPTIFAIAKETAEDILLLFV